MLDGPYPSAYEGKLFWNDEEVQVNTTFGFSVQQGDKLRAGDDLEMRGRGKAAPIFHP